MSEKIRKNLATSLTSLIFVVISLVSVNTFLFDSSDGDTHPRIKTIHLADESLIDKPFMILGNNISIVRNNQNDKNLKTIKLKRVG